MGTHIVWVEASAYVLGRRVSAFFTVSGSTLLRENVFILVLVYPDFLLALEPGEKKLRQEKKVRGIGEKSFQQEKKDFFSCLLGILASG